MLTAANKASCLVEPGTWYLLPGTCFLVPAAATYQLLTTTADYNILLTTETTDYYELVTTDLPTDLLTY